ncbi:hypothetical protein MIT9_P1311 [Methylomarinovum caldicuralii]|uniref:Uncharacterized protein n=1 Tax=Methylomarinovum caldicuralii TaxID=438856 RepID=A0AAU9C2B5_9GAMM|nr:hypothetical protein [Methylomarinovum caldicuralii]BCX81733.1 hypothetical protein MIT9_P1311 [Methylomarinovum caldicuralii]
MEMSERLQTDDFDDIDQEVEALFSQWREDQKKLAARRRVEQYLEMKRLREQIGDVFDLEDF